MAEPFGDVEAAVLRDRMLAEARANYERNRKAWAFEALTESAELGIFARRVEYKKSALEGYCANPQNWRAQPAEMARICADQADAMLAEDERYLAMRREGA